MARRALGPAALQLVQAVRAALVAHEAGDGIVVGCSGGADSTALALACGVVLTGRDDWQVRVVDHGLQPGSDELTRTVVARLVERGLPAVALRVEVRPDGEGMEAAAREARLRVLREPLPGRATPLVLLGHTLDDQAETVLLGLARGSGASSLSGMAVAREGLLRPLLGLRRATTEQACAEWGIETWTDPHNSCTDFARVRVRSRVLPVLEDELGPGVAEALARTAELLRADDELLDDLALRELLEPVELPEPVEGLDCRHLATLHPALRTRVLRHWLQGQGVPTLSRERTLAVDALVVDWHGQGAIDLPGGLRVHRLDGRLRVFARVDAWTPQTSSRT